MALGHIKVINNNIRFTKNDTNKIHAMLVSEPVMDLSITTGL